jgi:hypothetical protein
LLAAEAVFKAEGGLETTPEITGVAEAILKTS